MRIGVTELIVIFFVAVALFKPEKLKDYMRTFKETSNSLKDTKEQLQSEAKEIIDPVMEQADEIKKVA